MLSLPQHVQETSCSYTHTFITISAVSVFYYRTFIFALLTLIKRSASDPQAECLDGALFVPDIKLHSNPSAFNVYCNVRHCVLDWQQREASLALASRSSVQSGDSDSEEEEEYREPAVKLPKVRTGSAFGCL